MTADKNETHNCGEKGCRKTWGVPHCASCLPFSPDVPGECCLWQEIHRLRGDTTAIEQEQDRWQQSIYELLCQETQALGVHIDGAGCESGDPLAVTLAEIRQAVVAFEDQAYEIRNALTALTKAANEAAKLMEHEADDYLSPLGHKIAADLRSALKNVPGRGGVVCPSTPGAGAARPGRITPEPRACAIHAIRSAVLPHTAILTRRTLTASGA